MLLMANFGILFLCLLAGILFRWTSKFPKETPAVLNQFIFHVSLPAMMIYQFHRVPFDASAIFPVLMPWSLFLMSYCFFIVLGKTFQLTRKQIGALILTGGLGNTSFVGFPMLEALLGPDAIPVGMLSDQLGSFLILSTVGLMVGCQFSGRAFSWKAFFQRISHFPPFYALVLGILLRWVPFSPAVDEVLSRLAGTITPLAMASVGYQLRLDRAVLKRYQSKLGLGLGFKLILVPVFYFFSALLWFGSISRDTQITLIQSAMAPMISSGILAVEFGFDEELAGLMVGVGIPLSFLTVPLLNSWLFSWIP
jgi:predicted permease